MGSRDQSDASGRSEIVVRPFPSKDPAQPVSRDGGANARWRGDGKELFFLSPAGTMMAVGFDAAKGVPEGVPRALFSTQLRGRQPPLRRRQERRPVLASDRCQYTSARRHGLAGVAESVKCGLWPAARREDLIPASGAPAGGASAGTVRLDLATRRSRIGKWRGDKSSHPHPALRRGSGGWGFPPGRIARHRGICRPTGPADPPRHRGLLQSEE